MKLAEEILENDNQNVNEKIDLAILDIMLPDGNGYDLCKYIKENNDEIPVIFLTAKDEENNVVTGFNLELMIT